MEITLHGAPKLIKSGMLAEKTVIVVDAARTAACIVRALSCGCDRIIPAWSANEAAEIKRVSEMDMLLCGEISCVKVQGFDLGNSPSEYEDELMLKDKILVFSSTNGTPAIKKCEDSACTFIASFLNARAVVKMALYEGNDIDIVCAGSRGKLSTDDIVCAGYIIKTIKEMNKGIETDDFCEIAVKLYEDCEDDIFGFCKDSKQIATLISLGFESDIISCFERDTYEIVPKYCEGVITD